MTGHDRFARLDPGFAAPVHDAQTCFRAILRAMARPGRIERVPVSLAGKPSAPLGAAATVIALTLCDGDTPVWLDGAAAPAAAYLTFHCGAPLAAAPGDARFAFVAEPAAIPGLDRFALGSDEYPERSTTLVVEAAWLHPAADLRLSGPGIRGEAALQLAGLPGQFWAERAALSDLFPRGVDILFTCGDSLVALPRSARIAT